jgi:hypothetical protein
MTAYNKLVSVTGLGGLYELISSKNDGGVVKSLEDGKSQFVSNRVHSFSHLEGIEVYTSAENVNLAEVFLAMGASKEALPDAKADGATIQSYFGKVFPTMDFDRVYSSDMKKMVKWFAILKAKGVEVKLPSSADTDAATDEKPVEKKVVKNVEPKAAAAPKNAPAKKVNAPRKMA